MSSPQIHTQTYKNASIDLEPPPPSFSPIAIGDEDELETLPPYTNHLQLASLCRRKREFQAAFDKTPRGRRTWELVWLVLDGTALRVYRPKSVEKKAVENTDLGLVRMGSVESTRSTSKSNAALPFVRQMGRGRLLDQPIASGVANAPLVSVLASEPLLQLTRSRDAQGLLVDSSAPSPSSSIERQAEALPAAAAGRGHRRMDSKVAPSPSPVPSAPPAYPSHSVAVPYSYNASTPFLDHNLTRPITPASTSTSVYPIAQSISTSTPTPTPTPDFSKRKACRQYHIQHAICMRADAYTKREHVLRFILEDGKQFIVQLASRAETISWLQLMSIAAPLSLDLDERPMPEPAHYPRRRPRPRPRERERAQRRPSTAPGALERPTPVVTTHGIPGSLSAMGGSTVPTPPFPNVPNVLDAAIDSTGFGLGEGTEGEEEEEEEEDGDGDPLIVEEDMDHLPPPRRPVLPRSLSSVEQARRRGIQL